VHLFPLRRKYQPGSRRNATAATVDWTSVQTREEILLGVSNIPISAAVQSLFTVHRINSGSDAASQRIYSLLFAALWLRQNASVSCVQEWLNNLGNTHPIISIDNYSLTPGDHSAVEHKLDRFIDLTVEFND
jgi:hypothetical protein